MKVVETKVLKKPWKGNKKKAITSLLTYEKRQKIKAEKKLKADEDRKIVAELKEQKKQYFLQEKKKQMKKAKK